MHDEPCPHCNGEGVMSCPGCTDTTCDTDACACCDGTGVIECVFCEDIEGEVEEYSGSIRIRDEDIEPIYVGTVHKEQEDEDVTEIDGLEQAASMLSLLYERGYIDYDDEMAPDKERVEKVLKAAKSESDLW